MHKCVGASATRGVDGDLVVPVHEHVGAEHEERLHQVVGEGVVVVDQE